MAVTVPALVELKRTPTVTGPLSFHAGTAGVADGPYRLTVSPEGASAMVLNVHDFGDDMGTPATLLANTLAV